LDEELLTAEETCTKKGLQIGKGWQGICVCLVRFVILKHSVEGRLQLYLHRWFFFFTKILYLHRFY